MFLFYYALIQSTFYMSSLFILYMVTDRILQDTEQFMKKNIPSSRIDKDGSAEVYFRHVYGVRKYGLLLAEKYEADPDIIEIAALLHDVGADKGKGHAVESESIARAYLREHELTKDDKNKIFACIRNHSMGSEADSIEEQIIQDADGIIFLEDTYKFYFEKQKEKYPLEEARKITFEKTKGMLKKIKTEEGIRLAQEYLPVALDYLKNAS